MTASKRLLEGIGFFFDVQMAALIVLTVAVLGPIPFGITPYALVSSSMSPTYPKGTLLYVDTKVKVDQLQEGDVIAFLANKGQAVVTHRLIGKEEDTGNWITKGDANEQPDPTSVSPEAVIGRAAFGVPYLGALLRNQDCLAVYVLAPILFLDAFLLLIRRLGQGNPSIRRKEDQ